MMRNRLIGALTLTSMLAAGAAFAADATQPTMPGSAATAAVTAPAASSTTSAMPAAAAEKSVPAQMSAHTGVVKSFDAKTHKLTLKDGSIFALDSSLSGDDLKAEQTVALTFKTDGVQKTVMFYQIKNNG